jgi:hypothetical protein
LLHVWGRRLARMRGVGNKTRKRILAAVKVLRERLGSSTTDEPLAVPTDDIDAYESQIPKEQLSIDMLSARILRVAERPRDHCRPRSDRHAARIQRWRDVRRGTV